MLKSARRGLLVLGLLSWSADAAAQDYQVVRWNRAPIGLPLPVGQERYIWFPGRVQPGVPPELATKLRVQAVNDTVYLLAKEPFEPTRLPVRDLDSGDFYLFDVLAARDAPSEPLRVVRSAGRDEGSLAAIEPAGQEGAEQSHGYLELTRFAAQQLYAPQRLIQQLPGVSKVPLPRIAEPMSQLFRGGAVDATPVASWRAQNGLHVTAVMLVNRRSEPVVLDPRQVRGDWLAATLQHSDLGPNGEASDTSTIYLISDRSFLEVVKPWHG